MSKTFEFKVPGTDFTLKSNTIYQIVPKLDASAPDGFRDKNTTKVLSPNIMNSVQAPYSIEMGAWNTGFYAASACYQGMSNEEIELTVKNLNEHIVEPVERIIGKGKLGHESENKWYDTFSIPLGTNKVYNTGKPLDLLRLYLAILGKHLAPKEQQSHPAFRKAQFCVQNKQAVVGAQQERKLEKNRAIGTFHALYNSDKELLFDLMDYLQITNSKSTDLATLNGALDDWLDDKQNGFQNSKLFLQTYDKFKSESGKEELYIFKNLKKLVREGLIKTQRGTLFLDGKDIGNSYKHAARFINNSTADKEKIANLLERIDD